MKTYKLVKTIILPLALFWANGVQATSLFDLMQNNDSITAGDKIFNNWSFSQRASDSAFELDTNNIDVTGITSSDFGLNFDINNGGATVIGDGLLAFLDFTIGFTASVLSGNPYAINGVSLGIGSSSLSWSDTTNDLGIFIQEDVKNTANALLNSTDVEFSKLEDQSLISNISNSILFPGLQSINVSKNILVWASGVDETASLNSFDQRFSQTSVPEPETLWLLAIGLIGIGISKTRKSNLA